MAALPGTAVCKQQVSIGGMSQPVPPIEAGFAFPTEPQPTRLNLGLPRLYDQDSPSAVE